jgi:hypothetical protein
MKSFFPGGFMIRALAVMLALCGATSVLRAQVFINEVMAANANAVQNEGIYPDWVELYNTTSNAVDISDWSLSDSINTPRKFVFPAGTFIAPNGFLVVWCDNLTNAPGLHTGFTINGTTDDISLYRGLAFGGIQQDFISFGLQLQDLSIGRFPDGPPRAFTLTRPTPGATNVAMALSPPDNLKINEIMADPSGGDDWFELYNPETNAVALAGLIWSDRPSAPTNRTIANLSFIAPGGFIQFIADDLDNTEADHVDFALGRGGDRVVLYRPNRVDFIDRIDFGAQTNGVSYGRLPDGGTNLVYFAAGRSTPGQSNFQLLTDIIINEALTHTDPPREDAIELYNPTTNVVNIGGWWLSNSRDDPKKFRIPFGTTVQPGGYIVFYENPGTTIGFNSNGFGTNRSFTLNSARGDQIYLHTADAAGNLTFFRTSRDFGPAENGVSFGRYVTSEGKTDFPAMTRTTFGADNATTLTQFRTGTGLTNPYPRVGPLVINEIMYHPPDIGTNNLDNNQDEYVEIHNPGTSTVLLYDPIHYGYADGRTNTWRLRGTVDFDFPTNRSLAAGSYLLVVNFNPQTNTIQLDAFRAKYNVPTNIQIFGPYGSELANNNGSVELYKPDPPQAPDRGDDAGLVPYIRVDRVEYEDEAPWPEAADGTGPALQRLHVTGYGNDPTNWIAAAASPGAVFVPNSPPTITPIANITTNEMRRVQFFVTATDTDVPSQALTFSLEPGAPTNATIASSGLFRWRPNEEHGPGSYPITVRVTDNGLPPASSTATFTVTVNEVNRPPCFRIREQWVKAGSQLTFLTGFDVDLPPQFVTYSVVGTPPAGLAVNANTGEVTWTPTDNQASNVYSVTIEGVDDGEPNLTGRFTYTIHVLSSDAILIVADVAFVGSDTLISWGATPGRTYLVEYTENLSAQPPTWTSLPDGFIFADNPVMTVRHERGGAQRFYRISEIP